MHYNRPIVLSIAGFDPSGGAGSLADIKVFEQHRCLGFSAITAVTVQTENCFFSARWLSLQAIREQLRPLFENYRVAAIKIGLVENFRILADLIGWINQYAKDAPVIWDPVMASSSGFTFHRETDSEALAAILRQVYLVTPNIPEAVLLTGISDSRESAIWLSGFAPVLLKGGHSEGSRGTDYLWKNGTETVFKSNNNNVYPKHGSGCILSAAITARTALGSKLEDACREGKRYIETILSSNHNLLAYHHV